MSWFEICFYILLLGNIVLRIYFKNKKKKEKNECEKNTKTRITHDDNEVN